MSRIFLISLLFLLPPAGKDIVKRMHDRYAGKWMHSFAFNQTTDIYRRDSLILSQTWYEFIRFPDRFRMDFGVADSGNAAIFRGDSCYRFHNGRLRSTTINNNEGLIFLMGGMFSYPLNETMDSITALGYSLNRGHEDSWQGRPVYVIGAEQGDSVSNQLWVDQQDLYLVRMLRSDDGRKMDARFDNYQRFGGGFMATKCTFYINGRLAQVETYHDCKANVNLDDRIFDPSNFVHSH